MYSLYLSNKTESGTFEETLIYDLKMPCEELAVISPVLDIESGSAGSLDFTLPPCNVGYNSIDKMRTEVIFKQNGKEMWRGRVLNTNTDFYNQMKVECEGELSYLNDTYQPQKEYSTDTLRQFLEAIISIHNQKVDNSSEPFDKKFKIGAVFVNDSVSTNVMFRKTDYTTTLESLKSIADTYKGYFIVRKEIENGVLVRYLDFVKDFTKICNQTINFGENLLDYSKSFSMEDLCTVAMPIGAKMEDKAGDEITLYDTENNNPINYIYHINNQDDPRNGQFGYDSNDEHRYARVCYLNTGEFKEGDKIYVSVAQSVDNPDSDIHKDGIWCFADEGGRVIGGTFKYWSSSGSEVETYSKYELTIPPGAHRFRIAGYIGMSPELKVYRQKAKERVDECYTIENVASYEDAYVKHNEGDIYVINKPLFEKYGWHEKKLSFGDLDSGQQLFDMSVDYLKTTQFTQMKLELTAFDLSALNVNYDSMWINMNIPIYSKPHGIEEGDFTLPCTKISVHLDSPEDNEYSLGYSTSTAISDTQSNVSADISHLMDAVPSISNVVQSAKENANQIMNAMAMAGYVRFIKDPKHTDTIKEIVISNHYDPDQATKKWTWNVGGFAYQERPNSSGDWSYPDFAITMDGEISANRIVSGMMYADRIQGGDLILGTQLNTGDNRPGNIQVYDGQRLPDNSNRVAAVEKDYGFTCENPSADGWWMRMKVGNLIGGGKGSNYNYNTITDTGESCTGRINMMGGYVTGQDDHSNPIYEYGIDLRSKHVGLNCDKIWVSRELDSGADAVKIGQHLDIDVQTTGGVKHLTFWKGILVDYYDVNNGGE